MSLFCLLSARESYLSQLKKKVHVGRSYCTSTMVLSIFSSVATGQPPLPLAEEDGLAQAIDADHDRLTEF